MTAFVSRPSMRRVDSKARAVWCSLGMIVLLCMVGPLRADASAFTGKNKVKASVDSIYVRSAPRGPFIGTIHGGAYVYVESKSALYETPKVGKWVWGFVDGPGFEGCAWAPLKHLTHVSGQRRFRDQAKRCGAAPARPTWESVYDNMVDRAHSTIFSMSSDQFHSCDLDLHRGVDLAENWTGFNPKGKLGNKQPGNNFTRPTHIKDGADDILKPRFAIQGNGVYAMVARWKGHKRWGWVQLNAAEFDRLRTCTEPRAATRAANIGSEALPPPGLPCTAAGTCDGDAECNGSGVCEPCDNDMCGLDDDCEGSEPDNDPECGWTCEADCTDPVAGPTRSCTARCCNGALIGTPDASSPDQCDAQGQTACAGQGTTLHHVRFAGRNQAWHSCAKECCALCKSRSAYHQVLQRDGDWVFEQCTDEARAWCGVSDRGGLADAAWLAPENNGTDQCVPPESPASGSTCTARCCGGGVFDAGAATSAAQCDAQGQQVCAAHNATLHHVRFAGEAQAAHPCASECCALCGNRTAYHEVTQPDGGWVFENCADYAGSWCAQSDRGGLVDAAWAGLKTDGTDQCVPPAGYCSMQCHDGYADATHVTTEQQCFDATQSVCARHGGTEVLTLDARELYRRPVHTCTVRCCDGAVVGPVNSDSAAACLYQDAPPLCSNRGSTLNDVRYDGALIKQYDCPKTCTARCCGGNILRGPDVTTEQQCAEWSWGTCQAYGSTDDHVRFDGVLTRDHTCTCCALCGPKHGVSGSQGFTVFRAIDTGDDNCAAVANNFCASQSRSLTGAKWGFHNPSNPDHCQ